MKQQQNRALHSDTGVENAHVLLNYDLLKQKKGLFQTFVWYLAMGNASSVKDSGRTKQAVEAP